MRKRGGENGGKRGRQVRGKGREGEGKDEREGAEVSFRGLPPSEASLLRPPPEASHRGVPLRRPCEGGVRPRKDQSEGAEAPPGRERGRKEESEGTARAAAERHK